MFVSEKEGKEAGGEGRTGEGMGEAGQRKEEKE